MNRLACVCDSTFMVMSNLPSRYSSADWGWLDLTVFPFFFLKEGYAFLLDVIGDHGIRGGITVLIVDQERPGRYKLSDVGFH